jgi:starch synthase
MNIAFVTPEVFPFSKTGGLADVAHSLAHALAGLGVHVTVFAPFYLSTAEWFAGEGLASRELALPHRLWIGDEQHAAVYRLFTRDGVNYMFVDDAPFFDRLHCYVDDDGVDYPDNAERFAYFSRSVLEYYLHTGEPPDVFHCHDWQAALIPVYLRTTYRRPELGQAKSLLTLHNLGYHGLFPAYHLYATGLNWDMFTPEGLEFYGKLNLLKGGIVHADALNTVSPSYAAEIQTEEFGRGLDGVLRAHRAKLRGILNGVDTEQWNPATDALIEARYSADKTAGKAKCKKALQREVGLPVRSGALLLGSISRFDTQKGMDLVLAAFPKVAMLDLQLVLLGSGLHEFEDAARRLAAMYPQQVALRLGYDEGLAHRIEAGADAFLMPSAYEPCGLNQMYSQRYGALPIVRETGGLKDTVVNATPKHIADGSATGFTFKQYDAVKLAETIRRAVRMYHGERKTWRALMLNGMKRDFSWHTSALQYLRIYEQLSKPARLGAKEGAHG